ncbi:hypothetical protein HJC23_005018 [Cyclotella cryptica]|uniref:Amino acid transporter transmembrane domain-containing protein n=1 Tax=Cyclotella cryptica TaxID=29204 RepID=A0ABD3QD90_9STRA|eukprot:CCRYP_006242-RA/>CCRYP_006242-RA protein AED:0.23 eAED:0.23 QI:279/1/1/1/1/1/2/1421/593
MAHASLTGNPSTPTRRTDRDANNENQRQGTISSARFNLLSSMVGGGSLSLPLAFHQTGNLLVAPLLLLVTAAIAQQSIIFLVKAGIYSTGSRERSSEGDIANRDMHRSGARNNNKGTASYENVAMQAFGPQARVFSMALVSACCFFGSIGYCVLLRDMLEPIVDAFVTPPEGTDGGPTLARNAAMLTVVLFVTPLCTLRNLTALQNVGAASMLSVLTVSLCVAFRSIECQLKPAVYEKEEEDSNNVESFQALRALPLSMKELLDAVPLFISSYVCHFNVLPIHNELRCPTSDRVKRWIQTSIWPATLFYWFIGFTGSLYVKCTPSGRVSGNILLDFDENDPLLLLGRLCLAVTITLALPMLIIPARDIFLRSVSSTRLWGVFLRSLTPSQQRHQLHEHSSNIPIDTSLSPTPDQLTTVEFEPMEISQQQGSLEEPLLLLESRSLASVHDIADPDLLEEMSLSSNLDRDRSLHPQNRLLQRASNVTDSKNARRLGALVIFWTAALIACSVKSIDVVWDLLGSSFSIMMAFLIPCGAFLKLARMKRFSQLNDGGVGFRSWMMSKAVAWLMLLFFTPLMFVSTINAVYNNFFSESP